jgi:hypothetical protein
LFLWLTSSNVFSIFCCGCWHIHMTAYMGGCRLYDCGISLFQLQWNTTYILVLSWSSHSVSSEEWKCHIHTAMCADSAAACCMLWLLPLQTTWLLVAKL